jgi:hypothetical protein
MEIDLGILFEGFDLEQDHFGRILFPHDEIS